MIDYGVVKVWGVNTHPQVDAARFRACHNVPVVLFFTVEVDIHSTRKGTFAWMHKLSN